MNTDERAQRARDNFCKGYNCAQSVVLAFDDVLAEHGVEEHVAARMASPFGGGLGRMREVCGAVSGMSMVLGIACGYDEPKDFAAKKELYATVQELAGEYAAQNGSIVCRELLGLGKGPSESTPERRSEHYYKKRPCADLCASAARILAARLEG